MLAKTHDIAVLQFCLSNFIHVSIAAPLIVVVAIAQLAISPVV